MRPYPAPSTTAQTRRASAVRRAAARADRGAGQRYARPRSSALPNSHFASYVTMCGTPGGKARKSASAWGST